MEWLHVHMCLYLPDISTLKLFHIALLYLRNKKDDTVGEKGRVGILHVCLDKPWS